MTNGSTEIVVVIVVLAGVMNNGPIALLLYGNVSSEVNHCSPSTHICFYQTSYNYPLTIMMQVCP